MNQQQPKALPMISTDRLMAASLGALMGQLVLGISIHHGGSLMGLIVALVFVVSGGVSFTLFMTHRHLQSRPRTERAPIQSWLLFLGAALLASIHFSQ